MNPGKGPPSVYHDLFTATEKFENAWNHPDDWQWKQEMARSCCNGINQIGNHKVLKVIK
jgi:hypothetical protein